MEILILFTQLLTQFNSLHLSPQAFTTTAPTTQPTIAHTQRHSPFTSSILSQVNIYRASHQLPSLTHHPSVCTLATQRAAEIAVSFSHQGLDSRSRTGQLPYPKYTYIAENIAQTSSPNSVFTLWKNSPGHNVNMLSKAKYGCVEKYKNYYVLELWTP